MTQIIPSLADVSGRYDAVFCDLWGCLHNGQTAFPAAVAALQAFRAQGGKVLLLTNAPRPKPSVIKQLDRLGVPHDCYDEVVTSGDAAQYALHHRRRRPPRPPHRRPTRTRFSSPTVADDLATIAANRAADHPRVPCRRPKASSAPACSTT